jgi:hypothetical protein
VLERQPSDLPEAARDRVALRLRELAPPAAAGQRLVDQGVDEAPADLLEARLGVAVDDVDALAADDQDVKQP